VRPLASDRWQSFVSAAYDAGLWSGFFLGSPRLA
jgi:hypothetical protein